MHNYSNEPITLKRDTVIASFQRIHADDWLVRHTGAKCTCSAHGNRKMAESLFHIGVPEDIDNMTMEDIDKQLAEGVTKDVNLAHLTSKSESDLRYAKCMLLRVKHFLTDGVLDFNDDSTGAHEIRTTIPNPSVRHQRRNVTPDDRREIEKQTEEKLQQGIIEESDSPWSSNVVVIRKNGKARVALDLRALNKPTIPDAYPMPRVQDLTDCLAGAMYFTAMDAAQCMI